MDKLENDIKVQLDKNGEFEFMICHERNKEDCKGIFKICDKNGEFYGVAADKELEALKLIYYKACDALNKPYIGKIDNAFQLIKGFIECRVRLIHINTTKYKSRYILEKF